MGGVFQRHGEVPHVRMQKINALGSTSQGQAASTNTKKVGRCRLVQDYYRTTLGQNSVWVPERVGAKADVESPVVATITPVDYDARAEARAVASADLCEAGVSEVGGEVLVQEDVVWLEVTVPPGVLKAPDQGGRGRST